MTSKFYYDPARPSAFSTLEKLRAAVKHQPAGDIRAWLEMQDAYTLHRQVRKRFPRNPYSVNNVMDVWECDLVDVQAPRKFNDNFKYILPVIDVFYKFLHMVPLKSKTGTAVTAAFQSVLGDPRRHRRLIWVRTDKGKKFVNRTFRDLLRSSSFRCARIPT